MKGEDKPLTMPLAEKTEHSGKLNMISGRVFYRIPGLICPSGKVTRKSPDSRHRRVPSPSPQKSMNPLIQATKFRQIVPALSA
jgi:hypothetical protein